MLTVLRGAQELEYRHSTYGQQGSDEQPVGDAATFTTGSEPQVQAHSGFGHSFSTLKKKNLKI